MAACGLVLLGLWGCDDAEPRPAARSTPRSAPRPVALAPAPSASGSGVALGSASAATPPAPPLRDAGADSRWASRVWQRCHDGFRVRGPAKLDAQRLGLLCGPSNGMHRVDTDQGRFEVVADDCFRVFAVGEPPVEVVVSGPRGEQVIAAETSEPALVLEPDRPFCPTSSGPHRVRMTRGAGAFELWRLR